MMARLCRYVKTFLAICGGVAAVMAALLWRRRSPTRGKALQAAVRETKETIEEARQVAVVEMSAARRKEAVMKQRLRGVTAITDKARRREELLRLYEEASR